MKSLVRFGIVTCVGVAGLLAGGCSTNPTTGRSQLNFVSDKETAQMGIQAAPGLIQEFGGEVKNPALTGYVTEVGMKLKDQTEVDGPGRAWVFTLLDSDVINAFALPGERVFMSRGLADKLTSEAQLAGVLGHEIGHVMAKHTAERISQSTLIGGLSQIGGAVAGSLVKDPTLGQAIPAITNGSGQVFLLKFSRDQESEADTLGMRYMSKSGYNPRAQREVMEVLKAASGGGGNLEILATHPLPETRIQRVTQELNTTYAYTQSGPQAANYQDFADRYRQRYLSVRSLEPKSPAKAKKKAEAPVDEHGRARLLATIHLEDPTSWCAVCRMNAEAAKIATTP